MRILILSLVALIASCSSGYVVADTTLTWDHPTQRVDGTAFYPEEVSHYEIESSCGDVVTNYSTNEPILTYTLNVLGSCDLRVRVVDTGGLRSDYVTAINVNVKARPLPPFNFGVLN